VIAAVTATRQGLQPNRKLRTECYPSNLSAQRDPCWEEADVVHDPRPPLERNLLMVDRAQLLLAAPRSSVEERRSGTWATIRYARRVGVPVELIFERFWS
jgi:hypothetical protein